MYGNMAFRDWDLRLKLIRRTLHEQKTSKPAGVQSYSTITSTCSFSINSVTYQLFSGCQGLGRGASRIWGLGFGVFKGFRAMLSQTFGV